MPVITAPFGSWTSPITADAIIADAVGLGQVALDGSDVYWSEMRPVERGRNAIVRYRDGRMEDMLPPPYSARSRAHEYGGGAYTVADGVLYFCNDADQRIYRIGDDQPPQPITPESPRRYADLMVDRLHRRVIAVCEDHTDVAVQNSLIAIDLDHTGSMRTLVSGADFYAAPRLSPDGKQLAWLCWNHPAMPWDSTELWLADVHVDGNVTHARCIAGAGEESILQPAFAPDGTLYFVSDRNNWWNLYRWRDGRAEAVVPMDAEIGWPQWVFGESAYAFVGVQQILLACNRRGLWQLAVFDTTTGALESIENPYCEIHSLMAEPGPGVGRAVFVGGSATEPPVVARIDVATRRIEVLRRSTATTPDAGYIAAPEMVEFPTAGGNTAHAFFYPPRNRDFATPAGEKPPLLVLSHGGPTAAASPVLNLKLQYWTSRGFAVLDVNYRGSTGFGRRYRHALDGQWGVADVEDCVHGAQFLVQQNLVSAARLAIRGGSAGGYTTLCALAFHDVFRAGAVYYGVSDLEALARETHKFESRYLERLIGPYPQRRDLYLARSPIHRVAQLSCPVIFFQGLDDKVVPPDQTAMMVQALREKRIPVACIEFEGEAHGFRRADSIKRALNAELYFYGRVFNFSPADIIEPVVIENL